MEQHSYITGISHIAIVVPDIEEAWQRYQMLGFQEDAPGFIEESERGFWTKLIRQDGYVLELLSPLNEKGEMALNTYMGLNRYEMEHICYCVSDLEGQIKVLRKEKFFPISKPSFSQVVQKRVVLLVNRSMGVVELVEE